MKRTIDEYEDDDDLSVKEEEEDDAEDDAEKAEDAEEAEEDEEDDKPQYLDSSNSDRRVWLIKLPQFVAERWQNLEENNLDLGTLSIFEATSNAPARVALTLSDNDSLHKNLPKQYNLEFGKKTQPMYVFTEKRGRGKSVEGKIDHEGRVKPILNTEYREYMKQRTLEASKPKRTVQETDLGDRPGFIAPVSFVPGMRSTGNRSKVDLDSRRERLPKENVMEIIFGAFERHTYWNLRGLLDLTNQPVTYLKEILEELCNYNTRGPYKNTYQLKPEYKTHR